MADSAGRPGIRAIRRFIEPRSVAVVGASESSPRHAVRALLDSDLDVFLVNPRHATVFGAPAHPNLASIGQPVDAVLTLVNAQAAVEVVAQAARLGAGGVAVNAAGFAETGADGAELQARLVAAAGGMPVLGPNCNGFVNARSGAFLAGAPQLPLRPGGIGVITHSGGFITDLSVSAVGRQIGFSSLISTGNEAVTDLVDYLDYLIDDPQTRAIGLVVESLRRPEEFFAAVRRAHTVGKPVVAVKMGRSRRGQEVAASHTGAMIGDGWVYDAAFRQFGVLTARDLGDLLDRLMFFDQLPTERWTPVQGTAVVSVSGGAAALAGDVCEDENLHLPALEDLRAPIAEVLPRAGSINPIDLTGFAMGKPDLVESVLQTYTESPDVDAVVGLWTLGLRSRGFADSFLLPFINAAKKTSKPMVLSAIADARVSDWAEELARDGVAVGHGLRGTVRGLTALRDFAAARRRLHARPTEPASLERPPGEAIVRTPDGLILNFTATMGLLRRSGVPVAPFAIIGADQQPAESVAELLEPFVVKLADCPHRTDIGAVRVGISSDALPGVVTDLRRLAAEHGLPPDIVVQPQLEATNELFIGAQAESGLGPMTVCGLGGIHVEAIRAVGGLLAPFDRSEALDLIEEIDTIGAFDGARGAEPLNRDEFARILQAVGSLVVGAHDWLVSLDINPVLTSADGFVAVDGLVYVSD
ncbi:acetate--CoA ligase family protein [Streptomyces sp. NPDC054962]